MDGFDLAALDTLPHGLPGNAQSAHGLVHGEISLGSFFCDARTQIIGDTNSPRRAWSELFSGDDAVVEPAMNGRSGDAERRCYLFDGQHLTFGRCGWRLVASDVPVATQRSEEHTSELQSPCNLVCRLLLEKKKKKSSKFLIIKKKKKNKKKKQKLKK